jgi:hypothetical protein
MHTPIAVRPHRQRLSLAGAVAVAVAVLSAMLTLSAAPADAQEAPPATVGPCFDDETFTEYEYQLMTDPGSDPVTVTVHHYRRWRIWSIIPWNAGWEYTTTSPNPMHPVLQLIGGWDFTGTSQEETEPGSDPTYDTTWAEESPGEGWEPTGDSREDTREVQVPCDQPEPVVSVQVTEQEDCVAGVLIITTTTTTTEYVTDDEGLTWSLGEPVSVPVVTTEALGGPLCETGSSPTTQPTVTTSPPSTITPDDTTTDVAGGEVAGIEEQPDGSAVASSGTSAGAAAGATSLPRTGAGIGMLVLVGSMLVGLGGAMGAASRHQR